MQTTFEAEIHVDKQKMNRVLIFTGVLIAVSILLYVLGSVFWDTHTHVEYVQKLRGQRQSVGGWPVWACMIGKYLGVVSIVSFIFMFVKNRKAGPVMALNQEGLFVNHNGINEMFIHWSDIARIEKATTGARAIALHFYFADASKIVEAVKGVQKAFVKENLKDGKPFIIEQTLLTGDFEGFYTKAQSYLQKARG